MKGFDDSLVVRRMSSDATHVVKGPLLVGRAHFIQPYWEPVGPQRAECGARLIGKMVIMATGATVRCRACVHITGITEQSPAVHEKLGPA